MTTHITLLLDRTGSMEDIRDDVIGGFNAFLTQQKDVPEPTTFTLVQFDSQNPYELIHKAAPIHEVPTLTRDQYVPRASTPLYDAMGRGILYLEQRLAGLPNEVFPDKIIFVTVTDGHENASCEFDRPRVSRLIEEKKKLGWQFVFLSADMASFDDARNMGVEYGSSLMFSRSKRGSDAAWDSLSKKVREHRSGLSEKIDFSDEEREESDSH
ncbi:MAG TPA: hypothetical protein PKZ68_02855 [Pseudomonadales bacterium]|jgi:hypothetical protein|nr:hypothetical protein [Pseudomonadales bacterium]HNI37213.1 hypothetical protein [Pseudomonadales bacterium]HNL91463.1 hypothetical protein [Pseudomonadales bacterium]